jgi:hypothetical protein|tara:strand:- start:257 stop:625 length:369 start_codon:yes stop_codon:yes gene_type:complete
MSDHIKKFSKKQKDLAKLGAEGGLGLLGGAAAGAIGFVSKARKFLGKKAPKAMGADARAGITISKPNPQGIKGTGQSRTGKGKIHDVIPGGRSMKGMKSEKYSKLGSEGRRIQQQLKDIGLE